MTEPSLERHPIQRLTPEDYQAIESVDYALTSNLSALAFALEVITDSPDNVKAHKRYAEEMAYLRSHSAEFNQNKEKLLHSNYPLVVYFGKQLEVIDRLVNEFLDEVELVYAKPIKNSENLVRMTAILEQIRPLAKAVSDLPIYKAYRASKPEADRPVNP